MSLFGSLTTAISGLSAQSSALGYISDNVANSQTIGYKGTNANFVQLLTSSTETSHASGSVQARAQYANDVQGTITASTNATALAINGQGFFPVAYATTNGTTVPTFDTRQFYTRAGDFSLNNQGYLVNGQGYYLQGWNANQQTGVIDRTSITPIHVTQSAYSPVATTGIQLSANLPADNTATPVSTQVKVYDALGKEHTVSLTFTNSGTNTWGLSLDAPDDITAAARGSTVLQFGNAATPAAANGTIGGFGAATGSVTSPSPASASGQALVRFTADFGQGPQTIDLDLGTFGSSSGLTQFSGTELSVRNTSQNGVPPGSYSGITIGGSGDVSVKYDNGQSRVIARIPLAAFSDPNKLQALDGQAYQASNESGSPRLYDASTNGVGKLSVASEEGSNVDIAAEFSKLIVAQRAYSANTKIVTTTDELLQDTINMKR